MEKRGVSPVVWLGIFLFATPLMQAQKFHLVVARTPTSAALQRSSATASLSADCPDYQGVLSAIGAPLGQAVNLEVISDPAPAGGYYWNVYSLDPTVIAAGNTTQGFIPQVFTPEGSQYSSQFTIYGVAVGETSLVIQGLTYPDDGTTYTPSTAWAVNPSGVSSFLDANASDNSCLVDGALSADPGLLSLCGRDVNGTVSDGVSQLLLRVVAGLAGTACYSIISSGPPDQGTINSQVVGTQATGGYHYGFSYYQAPDGYGDTSQSRQVQVQFAYAPNGGNTNTTTIPGTVTIIRPPLVLIHGLWSNQGAWSGGAANWFRGGPYYVTYAADYASTNAANFSTNSPMVQTWVGRGLQQVRDQGFAATQADVVGHSMGGILTRLYAGSSQFARNDNYNLGDVHRLVTLDTPHAGASLANLIVSLAANSSFFDAIGPVISGITSIFNAPGQVDAGAICDLSENSPALQGLNGGTSIKSQVVTGTGGVPGTPTAPAAYFMPVESVLTRKIACAFSHCAYLFPQNVVNGFRFLQQNDEIVSLTSQQALTGQSGDQTNYIHTTVERGPDVEEYTTSLLDGSGSGFLSSLPGVGSNGLGNPVTVAGTGVASDRSDYAGACVGPLAPLQPLFGSSQLVAGDSTTTEVASPSSGQTRALAKGRLGLPPDPRIHITSPLNGQQFTPGSTVTVKVQVAAPITLNTGWVGTNIPGAGSLAGGSYTSDSYQATLLIPSTFSGPATITPAIVDSNSNPYRGPSIAINVVPADAPLSLRIQQPYNHLTAIPATASIYVNGEYPDEVTLNLSSPVTGTTYVSSDTNVATVDTDGSVAAVGFGTAIVTVQNNGVKAFATFVVENPAKPLPPQNMAGALQISQTGIQLNRNNGFYVQTVTITNVKTLPLVGPLYLVITGLPAGVNITNSGGGLTRTIQPAGQPYLQLTLPDGLTLQPGTSVSLLLNFLDPTRVAPRYTPEIFRTLGKP